MHQLPQMLPHQSAPSDGEMLPKARESGTHAFAAFQAQPRLSALAVTRPPSAPLARRPNFTCTIMEETMQALPRTSASPLVLRGGTDNTAPHLKAMRWWQASLAMSVKCGVAGTAATTAL